MTYPRGRYHFDGGSWNWHSGSNVIGPHVPLPSAAAARMFGVTLTSIGRGSAPPTDSFVLGTTQPDATNTGQIASGLPITYGDITVSVAGTVIDGQRIVGRVKVQAANVTIQNCEIVGNGYSGGNTALIDCNNSAAVNCTITNNLLHQDVSTGNLWTDAVIGHDYTATRNHIYNVVDGFGAYNSGNPGAAANVNIFGNYVHDLCFFSPDSNHSDNHTHNDGVQIQGNTGIVIRGNALFINASTTLGNPSQSGTGYSADTYLPAVTGQCVTGSPNVSQISAVTIDQNWMDYGSRGIVFIKGSFAAGALGSCTGNRFGSHLHSSTTAVQIDVNAGQTFDTFSGNTWLAGGTVTLSSGTG